MRQSIKLYYQLRKLWIWTVLVIVTILGLSSLVLNMAVWHQAENTFDSHFDAHHYYEMQDYAKSLVGTKKSAKIVKGWQNQFYGDISTEEKFSKSDEIFYYINTVNPNNYIESVEIDGSSPDDSSISYRKIYRKMIKRLPKTFEGFRKQTLQYYNNKKSDSSNVFSRYFGITDAHSRTITLPITNKSNQNGGPFNKKGFTTRKFVFNNPYGLGPILLIIIIGAFFFLLDQTHGINAYMLQRSKSGAYVALAKSLCWFVIPSVLSVFWTIFAYITKGLMIPHEFIRWNMSTFLLNNIAVLEMMIILVTVGLLIDSFIGSIFGKFYTFITGFFASILFFITFFSVISFLNRHLHWQFKMTEGLKLFVKTIFTNPVDLFSILLLIAIPFLLLALHWYRHYSIETDSKYIRLQKFKKPFFIFVLLLATWDFLLPLILSLHDTSSAFAITSDLSSVVWWVAWGIGITLFTTWMIFGRRPSFLRKKKA